MKKLLPILVFVFIFIGHTGFSQSFSWMQKAPIPVPGGVYGACSFTINNLIYIAGGCSNGLNSNYQDLWEYDPSTDVWTQRANMPLGGTYGSSAFVINNIAYVVTGWHRTGPSSATSFNFSYKYDPITNAWSTISSFPSVRYTSVAFELNGKGYLGTGYSPLTNDWWEYDPVTDAWSQKASMPGTVRQASHGFSIGGYGYLCMGGQYQVNHSDMWQYDAASNNWTQKANYPDTARSSGSTFVLNNKAYLMGGSNYVGDPFASIYSYDPLADQWTFVCYFPGGPRHALITAVANNKVYIGQGSYTSQTVGTYLTANDWWECTYLEVNTVKGKVFLDYNNNSVFDSGETECSNKMVNEVNSGALTFTRADGTYDLYLPNPGSYSVTTDSLGYFSPVPASYNGNFSSVGDVDSLRDFALQATTSFRDLSVVITPVGNFRPGFDATYNITYSNLGTNIENPVVTLVLDTSLSYVSATEVPSSVGTDTIVWTLPSITPFQSRSFWVTVNIDATTPIGDTITCPVWIEPFANDVDIYNNYSSWGEIVTGSFDPNDIQVNLSEITTTQLPSQPLLEYLIRFQNTGTDTAFNIDVVNGVPNGVELNTFELVSSSHPLVLRYDPVYNIFGFKFNNILLADSNINEPLSHGFIRYRIKPQATLQLGDVIENSAAIYFDFNTPVLTNVATTLIVSPTASFSLSSASLSLSAYPNPATNMLYLNIRERSKSVQLQIIDIKGKVVFSGLFSDDENPASPVAIKLPTLANGLYFATCSTESKKIYSSKIIIKN